MSCSRLLYEWIALIFLCHVVGFILCVRVTPLGLERMLALFKHSSAKGGVYLDFPQSSVAVICCDRAVSQCDRAVSQYDRAVICCDRAVSQCDRAISFGRDGKDFRGSFHVTCVF